MIDKNFLIQEKTAKAIVLSLSGKSSEQGGIIGCNENLIISDFIYDAHPVHNSVCSYTPDTDFLNNAMEKFWGNQNISFCGFVHSHFMNETLSEQDIEYARKVLSCFENYECLLMGIVVLDHQSNALNLKWYKVFKDNVVETAVVLQNGL